MSMSVIIFPDTNSNSLNQGALLV